MSCCTAAISAGSTPPILTCLFPTCRQAGKQFRYSGRRGGHRAGLGVKPVQSGWQIYLVGREATLQERLRVAEKHLKGAPPLRPRTWNCPKVGFAKPRATNLWRPWRRCQCTFNPHFRGRALEIWTIAARSWLGGPEKSLPSGPRRVKWLQVRE